MSPSTLMWLRWIEDHAPRELAPLARALAVSSIATGERLSAGERVGVRQSEETITESVLLELAEMIPELRIRTLTRPGETREGADWEWWIEGRKNWFHFLVQAKRIHLTIGGPAAYDVGYRPKSKAGEPQRPRQIDTLLATASTLGAPAIYTLYNQANAVGPYSDPHCYCSGAIPIGIDGITAVSAPTARRLLDVQANKTTMVPLRAIRPHAAPWSCLATCFGGWGSPWFRWFPRGPWDEGLPELEDLGDDPALTAAAFVLGLSRRTEYRPEYEEEREHTASLVSDGFRPEPPDYVPRRVPEQFDPSNLPPHPLIEEGTAPRFVAALYRAAVE